MTHEPSPLLIGDINNEIPFNYSQKCGNAIAKKQKEEQQAIHSYGTTRDKENPKGLCVYGNLPSIDKIPASRLHYLYPTAQLANGKIRKGRAMHISFEPNRSNILPYNSVSDDFKDQQRDYIDLSNEYEDNINEFLREEQYPKTSQAIQLENVSQNMGLYSALNEYFTDDKMKSFYPKSKDMKSFEPTMYQPIKNYLLIGGVILLLVIVIIAIVLIMKHKH